MTDPAILERFNGLSLEAKLRLLHDLRAEVLGEFEHRPATDTEKRFLDQRFQAVEDDALEDRRWGDLWVQPGLFSVVHRDIHRALVRPFLSPGAWK